MTRRTLLLAPMALAAQTPRPGERPAVRPRVRVVWIESPLLPASFRSESVVFPRAYVASPDPGVVQRALDSGRFPHAFSADDASLDGLAGEGDAITVMTTRSFDGDDSPFDRSIRVPFGIRWPGRLAPREAGFLISHVDVLPTIAGLMGLAAPEGSQGRDLSRLLLEGRGDPPEAVYAEGRLGYGDEWRVLIRGYDKLIWNLRDEVLGLYNLADDPFEETNLMDRREHALTRDSMVALADVWKRRLGDGRTPAGLRIRP